ncbi:DUF6503 family protein [Ekhidna sp.]
MKKFFILIAFFPLLVVAQITSKEVLAKSIKYHDPNREWTTLKAILTFNEVRPEGPERFSTFILDNGKDYYKVNRNDEEIYEVVQGKGKVLLGDKEVERSLFMRNYYLYLWGLPMKLLDEGTALDEEVLKENINGIACHVLRVVYEKDTWYFFIDQKTGRLVQYKFYKDEAAGKGELIGLEDEVSFKSLRFPQKRSWYTLPEMKYLGTDILTKVE